MCGCKFLWEGFETIFKSDPSSAYSRGLGTCMGTVESWPEPLIEHLRKGLGQPWEHRTATGEESPSGGPSSVGGIFPAN